MPRKWRGAWFVLIWSLTCSFSKMNRAKRLPSIRSVIVISDFLMQIFRDNGMEHFWFQQDGAPPHTALVTINFLKQLFPGRLMSTNGDFNGSRLISIVLFAIKGLCEQGRYTNLRPTSDRKSPPYRPKHWSKRWKRCLTGTTRHAGSIFKSDRDIRHISCRSFEISLQ